MTREDALNDLMHPPYDPEQLERDRQYIIKKLEVNEVWFGEYLNAPNHAHSAYPTEQPRWERLLGFWSKFKAMRVHGA